MDSPDAYEQFNEFTGTYKLVSCGLMAEPELLFKEKGSH